MRGTGVSFQGSLYFRDGGSVRKRNTRVSEEVLPKRDAPKGISAPHLDFLAIRRCGVVEGTGAAAPLQHPVQWQSTCAHLVVCFEHGGGGVVTISSCTTIA